jgi:hypothetical protein
MRRDELLYDKQYHLWRDGKYLGIATFINDENIGEAFVKFLSKDKKNKEVYVADEWKLVENLISSDEIHER